MGRFHGTRAVTSDAWSPVPEGIKMGLLVGEQSEDDEGEEVQQKLKPYLCEEFKSPAYLKKPT